jgi:hypothetical protein
MSSLRTAMLARVGAVYHPVLCRGRTSLH